MRGRPLPPFYPVWRKVARYVIDGLRLACKVANVPACVVVGGGAGAVFDAVAGTHFYRFSPNGCVDLITAMPPRHTGTRPQVCRGHVCRCGRAVRVLYRPGMVQWGKPDFVYLVATMPGRRSGDQVRKDTRINRLCVLEVEYRYAGAA